MSAVPAARYLTEFAPRARIREASAAAPALLQHLPVVMASEPDVGQRLAEAEARGCAEGRAAAEAEHEAELSALGEEYGARLVDERAAWTAAVADRLAADAETAFAEIRDGLAASVSRLLAPLMEHAFRERAVSELAAAVDALCAGGAGAVLRVSAPPDLIEALRPRFEDRRVAVEFVAGDSCEAVAIAGSSRIETQLSAFAERLREALP